MSASSFIRVLACRGFYCSVQLLWDFEKIVCYGTYAYLMKVKLHQQVIFVGLMLSFVVGIFL